MERAGAAAGMARAGAAAVGRETEAVVSAGAAGAGAIWEGLERVAAAGRAMGWEEEEETAVAAEGAAEVRGEAANWAGGEG
jgi:hypothetical protein